MLRKVPIFSVVVALSLGLAACGAQVPASTPTPISPSPTVTPSPTADLGDAPAWLRDLISGFERQAMANPPLTVSEYRYQGQTVYFVPQRCCDIPSDLYSADGKLIAHPDGGVGGSGDGRAPDFFQTAQLIRILWTDPRDPNPQKLINAPIVSAEVGPSSASSDQYVLHVVSALPNGCHSFAGWSVEDGQFSSKHLLVVNILNKVPVANDTPCSQIYRTHGMSIPLAYAFESGVTYTILVNDTNVSFTPPVDYAAAQAQLDEARALWAAKGPKDYTATFHWTCFCAPAYSGPVELTVVNGTIMGVQYAEGVAAPGTPKASNYMTVPQLFDLVQQAIDERAYRIDATYDASLGYPTKVLIDYKQTIADEERGFTLDIRQQ